jgi:uncharacterized protein (DUF4415 family)
MRTPLIDEDGEMREITEEDMKYFRPAREVLGDAFVEQWEAARKRRGQRGPGKKPRKQLITIRLDADIADDLQARPDWRQTANKALREWLGQHPVEAR